MADTSLPNASCEGLCPLAPGDSLLPSGMGRRDFLVRAGLFAAVAALAACGAGGDAGTAPTTISATTIKVSDYASLATVGGVALVTISGSPLAIVRTGDTTFVALSRICPHQGATVNATSTGFQCPQHGATFDKTGTWVGGQRTSNMYSYSTSYDSSTGVLTIG